MAGSADEVGPPTHLNKLFRPAMIEPSLFTSARAPRSKRRFAACIGLIAAFMFAGAAHGQDAASFDEPWSYEYEQKMVERMKAGIDQYLDGYRDRIVSERGQYWDRDQSSEPEYSALIEPNRARFREIIGLVDERAPLQMERFGIGDDEPVAAETDEVVISQVRWPVLDGVTAEGLLLRPRSAARAHVVALPDADDLPEDIAGLSNGATASSRWALRLAASGVEVLIPTLVDRGDTFSGSSEVVPRNPWRGAAEFESRFSNAPHREWIYRQAYVSGRHIIGLEIQKILAAVDWFTENGAERVGVAGYGEGGLLAFYAAAVDPRIDAALVSGYFGPRENLSQEPVYRNVWGLLKQFGDAEIASLIVPRSLVIEHVAHPQIDGPPPVREGRSAAGVSGKITTPPLSAVRAEYERLLSFFEGALPADVVLIDALAEGAGSADALQAFLEDLGIGSLAAGPAPVDDRRSQFDPAARQGRQVREMTDFLHDLLDTQDGERYAFMDLDWNSARDFETSLEPYSDYLYEEIIGRIDQELLPANPRLRQVYDEEDWIGYEVVLDVWPDVFAWGVLAVPKNIEPGEKRPTIVVQHGHAGTPSTPERVDSYNNIMPRLAQRGLVVFAPHNPYQFDVRKAFPLKTSVFSVIIPQYRQIVDWLKTTEHVDADRMAFYGKSWGGRTALRVPPFIPEFKAIINSAYFNQWPRKVMTVNYANSYMWTSSIGVYEFNMGPTLGHAEMAMLSFPRPYMIESGYRDGVAAHEWVGYEFAKLKRVYDVLGVGDRAVLAFHIGGHEVHADSVFPFLHEHLQWPVPAID